MAVIESYCLLWLLGWIILGIVAFACFLRFDAGPGWLFNLFMPLAIASKLSFLLFALSLIIKVIKYCIQ